MKLLIAIGLLVCLLGAQSTDQYDTVIAGGVVTRGPHCA